MNRTKLELKNLVFFANHGALQPEADLGQRFQLDVVTTLAEEIDLKVDDLEETVNYADIYDVIQSIFMGMRFNLIESCAESIADNILERFENVQEVVVRIRKPSVPVNCICDYFQVEVTRCR
ncbi:MAG: dihydroneopterin aldolase [Verrucomicrobiota bacterium]